MTIAFESTRRIAVSPSEVWAMLTDWSRAHEWMPGIDELVPDRPTEVGTVLSFTAQERERSSTITTLQENRRLVLHSEASVVIADYEYTLVPIGDVATEITLVARVEVRGAMRPFAKRIRTSIAEADRVQLDRLATLITD
ncbi:hypothetical protein ARHIZOSPH14_15310 [Agromyces rhizosphaerae]|uniref:SRPBCC family protein n=1 Tax=Agromyces rhizosphaerae TaxID=88374 RepID=A0A9W6CUY7_9MICO|nr:SRPBCC family protein [Agromyces rhizosphaerae]GLI27289.1 hypothetical protein ARHIZOSPH14_15310 [Agromyces rhizosphaerae]